MKDGTRNFRLWQKRVKDLLVQQDLLKGLGESKPNNMETLDLKEKDLWQPYTCVWQTRSSIM